MSDPCIAEISLIFHCACAFPPYCTSGGSSGDWFGIADPISYSFYRAMHYSAKRGHAITCRLSVRPSVCLQRW